VQLKDEVAGTLQDDGRQRKHGGTLRRHRLPHVADVDDSIVFHHSMINAFAEAVVDPSHMP